jgi:outer membrane protein TolC
LALAFAIGAPLDAHLRAEGDMGLPGGERALDARGPRTDDHPAVRAAEAHATQLVHETQVVHAALGPTFSVGGSVWREGSGDRAAAAIVSVPLPFFDPARYDSGRQAVAASAAREHVARLRLDLERESRLAAHEREHSREVVTQIRTGVVTPLRQAVATSLVAYGAGTLELGVVLLARRSALTAEERLVTATADVRRADVREAALAGTLTTDRTR